jgi:hypothetical protein
MPENEGSPKQEGHQRILGAWPRSSRLVCAYFAEVARDMELIMRGETSVNKESVEDRVSAAMALSRALQAQQPWPGWIEEMPARALSITGSSRLLLESVSASVGGRGIVRGTAGVEWGIEIPSSMFW